MTGAGEAARLSSDLGWGTVVPEDTGFQPLKSYLCDSSEHGGGNRDLWTTP